jgi:glyoxylase-like metal-dependent hydrolase (beta-lactamase superfamily II)
MASLCMSVGMAAALGAGAATAAAPPLTREVLADGVYLFRANSDFDYWTATNSVVIVGDDDVTVFDSHTRAATAQLVIAEIRKLTDKPVRTLINSHWHMDHWGGNDAYAKAFPGLQIVATAESRDFMSRMGGRYFAEQSGAARARAALDAAIQSGKLADGTPLTAELRAKKEQRLAEQTAFADEILATPRVLPNVAYRDELTLWRGKRELRLMSATGDASGATVLYLPAEKVLVTGDVLVSPEDGQGPPPWTTNSYAVTPWLESLRELAALDAAVVVPGQGPAFRDKAYLQATADLFAAIIAQVHAALARGLVTLPEVTAAVDVDAIGRRYPSADGSLEEFHSLVGRLVKKAHQEALDGAAGAG